MKKETTNTFNKGMVKDLHPLTTPDNILTDALNATLITYNGNEGVLQNDMGNVKIDAELPAGYVPVGMKEHGGIIYVAAYNPETGKGQVGSFPSPKQVIKDVEWSVNSDGGDLASITISPGVYEGNIIVNEIVKKELFGDNNGESRIFHPGDKFIINITNKDAFANYVDAGILDIELGVIKNDGGIEIMKTWTKGTSGDFLSCIDIGTREKAEAAIKDPSIVQVFDASSSGKLILIITLHTLDTFNVTRTYSLVEENNVKKIKVTFKGEAQKGNLQLDSTSNSNDFKIAHTTSDLYPNNVSSPLSVIEESKAISDNMGTESFTIYPAVPFGYIERMKKNITINFDKVKQNKDDFGEWRFYVTETYVKIGWSYDFYNLEGNKEIEYIKMYFHKLEDGYDRSKAKQVVFQKESYNGNFEDYINIQDTGLTYMNVYIVEIVKKLNNESESIIAFKMLYLSPLYNSQYNGLYKNNSIGQQENNQPTTRVEYDALGGETSNLVFTTKYETKLDSSSVKIKTPGDSNFGSDLGVNDTPKYAKEMTQEQLDQTYKQYQTLIKNQYKTDLSITGEVKNLNKYIIGQVNPSLISSVMNSYYMSSINSTINREFIPSTNTISFDDFQSYNDDRQPSVVNKTQVGNTINFNNIISGDSRLLQGFSSEIKHDVWQTYGVVPLCTTGYSREVQNKLAPYWNFKNALCISGDEDETKTIFYNSNLHENGVVDGGVDAGAGFDDEGLYAAANAMGKPMTNIFGGINGEYSELTFSGTGQTAAGNSLWLNTTLVNQDDDYLIACWKFNDGDTRFVNLMSRKYGSSDETHPFATRFNKWPRVDVMLRSILSQIFVVGWVTKGVDYILPNVNYYRYQDGSIKLNVKLNYSIPNDLNISDIMHSTQDEYSNKTLTKILEDTWGYTETQVQNSQEIEKSISIIQNGNVTKFPFTNLIPKVSVLMPNPNNSISIEIPDMYNMDMAIANYLNSSYVRDTSLDTTYDPKVIYAAKIYNDINQNINAEIHDDGIFEWKETPEVEAVTGNLKIRRWDYNLGYNDTPSTITFKDFGTHFMTYAALNDLSSLPEGVTNEVIANLEDSGNVTGKWTNAAPDHAPDLQINILYSEQVSPLERYNPFPWMS